VVKKKPPHEVPDDIESVTCPWCEGTGEEIVTFQGNDFVSQCGECFGTGEVLELVGEDLPSVGID